MWWLWTALTLAQPWTVTDVSPKTTRNPVLLVVTPGFSQQAFLALESGLEAANRDVHRLEFAASATPTEVQAGIASASAEVAGTCVAHGLGATWTLLTEPLGCTRLVLLSPVLDVWPTQAMATLAALPVGETASLGQDTEDAAGARLLGEVPHLGTVSGALARQVQGWVLAASVPLDVTTIGLPVWVGVSAGDEVAALEAVVPRAHELPDHHLERLGLNHWHPQDFSHLEMLGAPIPVRVAVTAVKQRRWRKQARRRRAR